MLLGEEHLQSLLSCKTAKLAMRCVLWANLSFLVCLKLRHKETEDLPDSSQITYLNSLSICVRLITPAVTPETELDPTLAADRSLRLPPEMFGKAAARRTSAPRHPHVP